MKYFVLGLEDLIFIIELVAFSISYLVGSGRCRRREEGGGEGASDRDRE